MNRGFQLWWVHLLLILRRLSFVKKKNYGVYSVVYWVNHSL